MTETKEAVMAKGKPEKDGSAKSGLVPEWVKAFGLDVVVVSVLHFFEKITEGHGERKKEKIIKGETIEDQRGQVWDDLRILEEADPANTTQLRALISVAKQQYWENDLVDMFCKIPKKESRAVQDAHAEILVADAELAKFARKAKIEEDLQNISRQQNPNQRRKAQLEEELAKLVNLDPVRKDELVEQLAKAKALIQKEGGPNRREGLKYLNGIADQAKLKENIYLLEHDAISQFLQRFLAASRGFVGDLAQNARNDIARAIPRVEHALAAVSNHREATDSALAAHIRNFRNSQTWLIRR